MPREPALKRIILEKAIQLFGERGYHGITTEALATAADANEASLFQHFESKEGLYRAAITEVGGHTEQLLGKALLDIYAKRKNRDQRQFAFEALRQWYLSVPQHMARLLQQALITHPEHRAEAYEPIRRIIDTLDAALEGKTRRKRASSIEQSAEIVVSALFQYKVVLHHGISEKEETEGVAARITHWIDDVLAGK